MAKNQKPNLADMFIHLNKFSDMVRELHQYPDLEEDEKKQIRSAIKIMKTDIEELFNTICGKEKKQ
jgi:predicted component of type VI protein secretion system